MAYEYVLCRSTGEPVGELLAARTRTMNFSLNGVHSAGVTLQLGDGVAPGITPGLSRLKVWRTPSAAQKAADPGTAKELVFYGSLPSQNMVERAAAETVECTFLDPRWTLNNTYATIERYGYDYSSLTPVSDAGFLNDLVVTRTAVSFYAGGLVVKPVPTIRAKAVDTGVKHPYNVPPGTLVMDKVVELTRLIDGPDWDIIPVDGWLLPPVVTYVNQNGTIKVVSTPQNPIMGDLAVYARQGVTRPNAVFTYGAALGGSNCRGMTRTYQPVVTYNNVTTNPPDGSPPFTESYARNTETYGVLGGYSSTPDGASSSYAQFVCRGPVEAYKQPRQVITIEQPTPQAPRPHEDYRLGDTVWASCRKGSMVFTNAALRVHGIQITIDQEGNEQVTLTTQEAF